jgi:hypothetical protein
VVSPPIGTDRTRWHDHHTPCVLVLSHCQILVRSVPCVTMNPSAPTIPHARRRRAFAAAAALGFAAILAMPSAASAQEACTVSASTTGVSLGANVASEPGVNISISHSAAGATSWAATGVPSGASFSSTSGTISGAPVVGSHAITVTATTAGGTCSRSFTWYVNDSESGSVTPELPPSQLPSQAPAASPSTPAAAAPSSNGTLAFTGGDVAGLVVVGFGAIGLGWLLLWSQRRRKADQPAT